MRILFWSIVLSLAVPSLGIAQDAPSCAPGWVTNTCADYTGCAQPDWVCCPDQSGDGGWQWGQGSCPGD
jgi:hypothetical protein